MKNVDNYIPVDANLLDSGRVSHTSLGFLSPNACNLFHVNS